MGSADWVKATGIEMPQCKMQGCCCRGASPSTPTRHLLEKAAAGDTFAQNFFSIFVPYASHEEARQVVPGLVERTLKAAEKDPQFESPEDVVFFHCRNIGADNKCQVWEDRPDLCRAYPDSPFVVFAPNCAFEPWSKAVKAKFAEMKSELSDLREQQAQLQAGQSEFTLRHDDTDADLIEQTRLDLGVMMMLTPQYMVSPLTTVIY